MKETLPDFREKCLVTRYSRVFRELTGSQQTLGFGVSQVVHMGLLQHRTLVHIGIVLKVPFCFLFSHMASCNYFDSLSTLYK